MTGVLLSFGHGYSAQALAAELLPLGWQIIGTNRSGEVPQEGVETVAWPGTNMAPYLDRATHLLISAGPDDAGDPVLNGLREEIKGRSFDWVGYLSTTGVYGDHQGGWVDENTPLTPSTRRGKLRVVAEANWQAMGLPLHIFRLAGIYGPGRGPFAKVRAGTARRIIKENQVFSRIHVEDIAQVLAASIARPNPGTVYNLCDNEAAPPEDVIGFAAELLGVPVPAAVDFDKADMSAMARSFYAESKRVSNDRIKTELCVVLKYADYRSGLRSLLAAEDG
ncbi:SDR family oxidoreductase [Neptunicoccus cionae]|uniref:NAD(P)-dependent oxidoreductase n=1 Tax=Neptunicoccus cionae TaxID=2035344 RepID=A0A916QYA5_9RHOB|nr:SDR family oxidoreductase [Amylibacter cionae]GGA19144.1 NAD(P)-dependent oxidoreductase [Amylibacter cionae]